MGTKKTLDLVAVLEAGDTATVDELQQAVTQLQVEHDGVLARLNTLRGRQQNSAVELLAEGGVPELAREIHESQVAMQTIENAMNVFRGRIAQRHQAQIAAERRAKWLEVKDLLDRREMAAAKLQKLGIEMADTVLAMEQLGAQAWSLAPQHDRETIKHDAFWRREMIATQIQRYLAKVGGVALVEPNSSALAFMGHVDLVELARKTHQQILAPSGLVERTEPVEVATDDNHQPEAA